MRFAAPAHGRNWPLATHSHVPRHVGDCGMSGRDAKARSGQPRESFVILEASIAALRSGSFDYRVGLYIDATFNSRRFAERPLRLASAAQLAAVLVARSPVTHR